MQNIESVTYLDRARLKTNEINVTNSRHFAFVYLLGKLDYSLYGQQNKNPLYMFQSRI